MGFAKFSSDFLMETFTLVDNLFINEHLPYLDEKQIKVYLYGLYLCTSNEQNDVETLGAVLDVTEEELLSIYGEFEDLGLVKILSRQPIEVKYLSLKRGLQPPKKYKADKWTDFNSVLQSLFPERLITPNEYNEYYSFIESTKIDTEVLLMIVQYSINAKGQNVRYPYIFTVARSWLADGVKTVADVEKKLTEYEAQNEDMREVLVALGRKGGADIEDKQALLKWQRSWGFEQSAILTAAKLLKGSKTFKRLDQKLDEYYRMNVFTSEEMEDANARREKLVNLAIEINKTMGLYYESLDHVLETYTIPWTGKGFTDDALLKIAHYCFVSGIRTLDGLNNVINKFYQQGYVSAESIDEFISAGIAQDSKIRAILEKAGTSRNVSAKDREYYRTWTTLWGFGDDMIEYACELACGKPYPVTYINQVLSGWKSSGINTLDKAKALPAPTASKKPEYTERNYSEDELHTLFSGIDQFDDIDI